MGLVPTLAQMAEITVKNTEAIATAMKGITEAMEQNVRSAQVLSEIATSIQAMDERLKVVEEWIESHDRLHVKEKGCSKGS